MFSSFFIGAFRHFRKNRIYSFLNIFGLAVGIACAGLIFLWVEDELNYDNIHVNKERFYFVRVNPVKSLRSE